MPALKRAVLVGTAALVLAAAPIAAQEQQQPNILVIWGDDIGVHNISAYNHGIMGYETPNIDRIADEGAMLTHYYAQQSCTAGRAAFILGQHPFRTGLLTIGMPGSEHGIPDWAPTLGDLLKQEGYATGQFGKNHLSDRDKHLPTNHGFDEFVVATHAACHGIGGARGTRPSAEPVFRGSERIGRGDRRWRWFVRGSAGDGEERPRPNH